MQWYIGGTILTGERLHLYFKGRSSALSFLSLGILSGGI